MIMSICSYGMFPYHVYLDKVKQATPLQAAPLTIVAAFNSGIYEEERELGRPTLKALPEMSLKLKLNPKLSLPSYEEERELWRPTLKALVAAGTPCVFTSYNQAEAKGDEVEWKAAGGAVLQGPKENPYRSLEPIMEPSAIDTFYFQNYWYSLFGKKQRKTYECPERQPYQRFVFKATLTGPSDGQDTRHPMRRTQQRANTLSIRGL
eukprot:gene22275-29350_t